MSVQHYWIGNKTGLIMSTSSNCPIKKPKEKLKYMGYTTDYSWPKRMNTGRLLYKFNYKSRKKNKKHIKMLSNAKKTDTIFKEQ